MTLTEERTLDRLERAVALNPGDGRLWFSLGLALKAANRASEAEAAYGRAIALDPGFAPAYGALGVTLAALGQLSDAAEALSRAVAIDPPLMLGWANLAVVLKDLGRLGEALEACRRAMALEPQSAAARNTEGDILRRMGRLDRPPPVAQAMALEPGWSHPRYNLAGLRRDQGRTDEAIALYEQVVAQDPGLAEAHWALCVAELQPLYDDDDQILRRRQAYEGRLKALDAAFPGRAMEALGAGVGASQPFHLAYQGLNDRDLQSRYGRLVNRALPPAPLVLPLRPKKGEPIRVAFVSGYLRQHANWRAPIRGWMEQLDRDRFELFGYHTGAIVDAETARAEALCARFVQGPLPEAEWIRAIIADRPHVIVYPELGMDPMALRLAARRLARVQCASWGHPVTSGLGTVDYFLSSALMEPDDAQDHYAEKLVRLPNLSIWYEPPDIAPAPVSREALGLDPQAPLFWCGQSLYKFQPGLDEAFARIAKIIGPCQFLFLEFPGSPDLTERFRARLRRAFSAFGLEADRHCVILPRLSPERYLGAAGLCDVVLDSIGWSGCNTLLEGLAHDTPIVTLPGPFMRGRHGSAILRRMGLDDMIAADLDLYVDLAARLATDPALAAKVRARIGAGKARIYRDPECIAGLESFLQTVALT